jgi:hypothetical protein
MGSAYAITLQFSTAADVINFTVDVDDWTDVEGDANEETEVSKTEKAATQE